MSLLHGERISMGNQKLDLLQDPRGGTVMKATRRIYSIHATVVSVARV